MSDILIVFGTDTGNTEEVAEKLSDKFNELGHQVELCDVASLDVSSIDGAQICIFGIPTCDFGGIQGDWEDFEPILRALDFKDKAIALYGLGDQFGYGDYFIDAVGWLHEILTEQQARFYGYWPTSGYEFDASRALSPCKQFFYGLAIDEDQQFEQSDARIEQWEQQLCREIPELAVK